MMEHFKCGSEQHRILNPYKILKFTYVVLLKYDLMFNYLSFIAVCFILPNYFII